MKTLTFTFSRAFGFSEKPLARLFPVIAGFFFAAGIFMPALAQTDDEHNFITAASDGNIAEVNRFISAGINVNVKQSQGNSALDFAAINGHVDVVNVLIAAGANVNTQDNEGGTPLISAAGNGHLAVVHALIAANANVNLQDNVRVTPLIAASYNGHLAVVNALIAANANVNLANQFNVTPLMWAANFGHTAIANRLIMANANLNTQSSSSGRNALMLATRNEHLAVVNALITAGANLDLQATEDGWTALLEAVYDRNSEIVNALITAGANVNTANNDGIPPLGWAEACGYAEISSALRQAGATPPTVPYDVQCRNFSSGGGGSGGGGGGSTGAIIGGVVVVGAAVWYLSQGDETAEKTIKPVFGYSNDNGVWRYETGIRQEWTAEKWNAFHQVSRIENSDGAEFAFNSGADYFANPFYLSFGSFGKSETVANRFSISLKEKFGAWQFSPNFAVQHKATPTDSEMDYSANLAGQWNIRKGLTIAPSVTMFGATPAGLGDNAKFNLSATYRF